MESQPTLTQVIDKYELEPDLLEEITGIGRVKKIKNEQTVIRPGGQSAEMPIVLQGLLKVMRPGQNDREIFLYYLEPGEICAMSITCCLEGKTSQFKVVAEEDSIVWMTPVLYLDSWIKKYSSFRKFIFRAYQKRFDELLETVDSIAFLKLDDRLYKFLLDKKQATGSFVINMTHEQIARELNSSRVVISRLLKQLEMQQKIEHFRNRIEIL